MKFVYLFVVVAALVSLTAPAIAQEGHPLTGSWYGDFGMSAAKRNDLTVVMKWDGSATTGIVNPGPGAVPLKIARLDVTLGNPGQRGTPAQGGQAAQPAIPPTPPTFAVHFEADAKNKTG